MTASASMIAAIEPTTLDLVAEERKNGRADEQDEARDEQQPAGTATTPGGSCPPPRRIGGPAHGA